MKIWHLVKGHNLPPFVSYTPKTQQNCTTIEMASERMVNGLSANEKLDGLTTISNIWLSPEILTTTVAKPKTFKKPQYYNAWKAC